MRARQGGAAGPTGSGQHWLARREVLALGINERQLTRHLQRGTVTGRGERGSREFLLSSLPRVFQLKYLRREDARHTVTALANEDSAAGERLGRFDADTAAAMLREAGRLYELILRFGEISPKWIDRQLAPAVRDVLAAWPTTDQVVLRTFPSWAGTPTFKTLQNKLRAAKEDGSLGLIPRAPHVTRSDDRRLFRISPEMRAELEHMRLSEFKHFSVAGIYRRLKLRFPAQELPSESTVRRLVREIPRGLQVLAREGAKSYRNTVKPYIKRGRALLDVGQRIVGDVHTTDFRVINPARKGGLDRLKLAVWLDEKTRAPMGWAVGFDQTSRLIAAAFVHAVSPKAEPEFAQLCGLPEEVQQDNGTEFNNAHMTGQADDGDFFGSGVLHAWGIRIKRALPYRPRSKTVERFFGTFCSGLSQALPIYFGNSNGPTPDTEAVLAAQHDAFLAGKRATSPYPTLAQATELVRGFMVEYMTREHRGLYEEETGRSLTPAQAAALRVTPPRIPSTEELALVAWPSFKLKVRQGLLQLDRHFYRAMQTNTEELDPFYFFEGKEVRARRNPADVRVLVVHTLKGEFIANAQMLDAIELPVDGKIPEAALREEQRLRREESRIRRQLEERTARRLTGKTDFEIALEKVTASPATPPPPAPPPPSHSTNELRPRLRRLQQDAKKALEQRVEENPFANAQPLPVRVVGGADLVLDSFHSAYGDRPQHPGRFAERHQIESYERLRAFWDGAYREHYGKEPPID